MKNDKKNNIPYIPMTRDKSDPLGMILTDPFGSYTGRPLDISDEPMQDADDL